MKKITKITWIAVVLLVGASIGVAWALSPVRPMGAGKQCECSIVDIGDARCFLDGSTCPKSGGKCNCFEPPTKANHVQGGSVDAASVKKPNTRQLSPLPLDRRNEQVSQEDHSNAQKLVGMWLMETEPSGHTSLLRCELRGDQLVMFDVATEDNARTGTLKGEDFGEWATLRLRGRRLHGTHPPRGQSNKLDGIVSEDFNEITLITHVRNRSGVVWFDQVQHLRRGR